MPTVLTSRLWSIVPRAARYEPSLLGKSSPLIFWAVLTDRFVAFIMWRSFYATATLGWRNKLLVPVYWTLALLFGRDVTRF
jgi:NADH dehydrogenase FAD-containing subunit